LIKVREENKLSQKCTLQIASATENYIRQSINNLKRKVDECLANAGIEAEEISGYEDSFVNATPSFQTLSSDLVEHHRQGDINLPFVVRRRNFCHCRLTIAVNKTGNLSVPDFSFFSDRSPGE